MTKKMTELATLLIEKGTKEKNMKTEYATKELNTFYKQMRKVEIAPLGDRQLARSKFETDLRYLSNGESQSGFNVLLTRILWLIDGNYGYGSYIKTKKALENKRMNRSAWLFQTIAALEWQCPPAMAREVYNRLSATHKDELSGLLHSLIAYWENEQPEA